MRKQRLRVEHQMGCYKSSTFWPSYSPGWFKLHFSFQIILSFISFIFDINEWEWFCCVWGEGGCKEEGQINESSQSLLRVTWNPWVMTWKVLLNASLVIYERRVSICLFHGRNRYLKETAFKKAVSCDNRFFKNCKVRLITCGRFFLVMVSRHYYRVARDLFIQETKALRDFLKFLSLYCQLYFLNTRGFGEIGISVC